MDTTVHSPSLTNQRILVVGASSGIGCEFAKRAAAGGATVAAAARRGDRLQEEFGATTVLTISADATNAAEAADMVAQAASGLGGFDLVVYAAGAGTLAPLLDGDPELWARDHRVNVIGANLVCAAALEHLSPGGVMAFVSSRGSLDHHWGLASYASSKAALDSAIEGWRVEHPDRRFLRLVMGNVMSTEFANNFDPEIAGAAFPNWIAQGIPLDVMEAAAVGHQLADLMAVLLAHPTVDVPELRLDARRSALG